MKPFRITLFLFLLLSAFAVVSCKDPFLREDVDKLEKQEETGDNTGNEADNYIRELTDPGAALAAPNCIMVKPGAEISIPVAKAFAVWQKHRKLFGKKFSGKGDLAPVLMWALPNDLADADAMEITGYEDINKAAIRVKTKPGTVGNALVALAVQGEIRWSWHLWVTEYNPGADICLEELKTGPNSVPGGNVFRYKNYCGDNIFMDRNLGANGADKNKPKEAIGMYYQWGRKDPFPGFAIPNFIADDINDFPTEYRKNNLAYSIEFPDEIINHRFGSWGHEWGDWYSYYPGVHDIDLWGDISGRKSIYDPCPEGWWVPRVNTEMLTISDNFSSPFYIIEPENQFKGIDPENSSESPVLGFFPRANMLWPKSGEIMFSVEKTLWTATHDYNGWRGRKGYAFDASVGPSFWVRTTPSNDGYNLRCIRDLSNKQ